MRVIAIDNNFPTNPPTTLNEVICDHSISSSGTLGVPGVSNEFIQYPVDNLKFLDAPPAATAIASVANGNYGKLIWLLVELPLGVAIGKDNTITIVDDGTDDIFFFD